MLIWSEPPADVRPSVGYGREISGWVVHQIKFRRGPKADSATAGVYIYSRYTCWCCSSKTKPGLSSPALSGVRTRGDVLSISASSLKPEGTSVSSSGLDMSVQSRSLSISGEGKTPEGLIRPGGSPPRPRRTGAAGHSAALAARERDPSAVDAGVASARAARSNRLVRGLWLLQL